MDFTIPKTLDIKEVNDFYQKLIESLDTLSNDILSLNVKSSIFIKADDYSSINDAITDLPDNGGTIILGDKTYTENIEFPNDPKVVNIIGAGINVSILEMPAAAGPMCHKVHSAGRITGAYFSDFTIKAHASSDISNAVHMAWELAGWGASTWQRIAYKSNGTGSVYSLFYVSSDTYLTYKNTFKDILNISNRGPRSVVLAHAADAAHNTNLLYVDGMWCYYNTDMVAVLDLADCTLFSVTNSLIESNTGAKGIILGQDGYINGNWLESNLADNEIVFQNSGTVTSSKNYIGRGNYFSGSSTLTIPASCDFNFIDNSTITSISDSGSNNFHVTDLGANPTVPTISTGVAGTLALTSASVQKGLDPYSKSISYKFNYAWTPTSAGNAEFTLSAISGYTLVSISAGCILNGDGSAQKSSLSWDVNKFWVKTETTGEHSLIVLATFKK